MSGDETAARAALQHAPDSLTDPGMLHAAASLGNVAALRCLLSLGADPNATAAGGTTALHQAAWNDRRAAAEVLVAHGARPLRDANHGSTPAGWADHAGHAAMRDYLLDHCPDGLDLVSSVGSRRCDGTCATSRLCHQPHAGWRLAPPPPA